MTNANIHQIAVTYDRKGFCTIHIQVLFIYTLHIGILVAFVRITVNLSKLKWTNAQPYAVFSNLCHLHSNITQSIY